MKVTPTDLPGVLLVDLDVHGDDRGHLFELYQADRYVRRGITARFVQDNVSFSRRGVLRGLHLQHPAGQAKLVQALAGEVFDVAVDVRLGSPTFGRWIGAALSADNGRQIFIPEGFAHGFCVLSETALVMYKCSDIYDGAASLSILWNDPDLAIDWPVREPLLSPKDARGERLAAIDPGRLPGYGGGP
jgi:dTDP-4-dehydrorhamnose 3,5-epimerase